MNIFVLSLDPREAARYQCDKHVPKMLLESVQLLCNPVSPELREKSTSLRNGEGVYKRAHYNHPCSVWARETRGNWTWLLNHAWALLGEYKFRFDNKPHKCEEMLTWLDKQPSKIVFVSNELTLSPFAQAMPEKYKHSDAITAYRSFYRNEKTFAAYNKGRPTPPWWNQYSTSISSPVIEIT